MQVSGQENAKKAAGEEAAKLIQSGMRVGLGTGSTTKYFIKALAKRCEEGLSIKCVATSKETECLGSALGLPMLPIDSVTECDIDIDGADQIDEEKNMIKGGGGALLREKIIANSSNEMIILIDATKRCKHLGNINLPLEILPFGAHLTIACIQKLGYKGSLRKKEEGYFISDNSNYIFDIHLSAPLLDPEKVNAELLNIPGLLETGLFLGVAGRVIMGNEDSSVTLY